MDCSNLEPWGLNISASRACRRLFVVIAALCVSACSSSSGAFEAEGPNEKPNVLLILADDLGYSDIGAFGGEIDTPNLDRLAVSGMLLTDFHTAPTCSPTRAMLMTGNDNHVVGLGTMAEALRPEAPLVPGYEGYLNNQSKTIAEVFREAGYKTVMAGKWHLGKDAQHMPDQKGFENSFALLDGSASHFGSAEGAPSVDVGVTGGYREDGQITQLPAGKYAGDVYSDRIVDYIGEPESRKRPFFAYLAYTAPHWPLQAPQELIDKYRGRYDAGPDALRQQRLQSMIELGLMPATTRANDDVSPSLWSSMTQSEKDISAKKMEVYAAMVESLDRNIGQVLQHLEDTGELENTIILFLSDNGADGTPTETLIQMMQATKQQLAVIDNSLENLGRANSYAAYGPDWAQASMGPFNRHKAFTTEGGTRVPAVIAGPSVEAGKVSNAFLHVTDILPTLVDMTGISTDFDEVPAPPTGKSFSKVLRQEAAEVRSGEPVGWELFHGRALRIDDWKAVMLLPRNKFLPYGASAPTWMLFDLANDLGETTDLSETHPQKLEKLIGAWNDYAERNGVIIERDE
eukprot:TRINITY_DN43917_c0_g1_i1.p1 TRINITY_DN43917_c0_g1~~TRINITY_DN43917_c0_g1_i1.p1  ORF type:complete len:573 (+),score=44.09 TRINITY_DN43917_c0_g1_i1:1203-2921(+)